MKHTIKIMIALLCAFQVLLAGSKIGVVIKIKGDVTILGVESNQPVSLKPGHPLYNQDLIKTGESGFATTMYLDDRTIVKISKNSEFTIGGKKGESGINKSLDVSYGTMRAQVAKQKGKEFLISTPTSVASVKGTDIIIIADPDAGDQFLILEGLLEVTNNMTGETQTVGSNETANSNTDGSVTVTETSEDDVPSFEDEDDEDSVTGGAEGDIQELRFEVEDDNGNVKEIIIRFQ